MRLIFLLPFGSFLRVPLRYKLKQVQPRHFLLPFGSFKKYDPRKKPDSIVEAEAFYSLLGVSPTAFKTLQSRVLCRAPLSTPFWEFRSYLENLAFRFLTRLQ